MKMDMPTSVGKKWMAIRAVTVSVDQPNINVNSVNKTYMCMQMPNHQAMVINTYLKVKVVKFIHTGLYYLGYKRLGKMVFIFLLLVCEHTTAHIHKRLHMPAYAACTNIYRTMTKDGNFFAFS